MKVEQKHYLRKTIYRGIKLQLRPVQFNNLFLEEIVDFRQTLCCNLIFASLDSITSVVLKYLSWNYNLVLLEIVTSR